MAPASNEPPEKATAAEHVAVDISLSAVDEKVATTATPIGIKIGDDYDRALVRRAVEVSWNSDWEHPAIVQENSCM
jgi:hypothetical protein